ncbi:MAG: SUMF1/EgtB/PvdO family nonheme iron enzyme [Anaerolineales bacterium]|nr:SUMF1/EgtB/PvdO family nonheme iron enzyme [Anaerolineales bacterium]
MHSKHPITRTILITTGLLALSLGLGGCAAGQADEPGIGSTQTVPIDGMLMVYVPAGEFVMGSEYSTEPQAAKTERGRFVVENEDPPHTVYLDAFWIDQTEVTQEMYAACVAAGACREPSCGNVGENYPVVCVSRKDAMNYCTWAGRQLPSEAQWEKAARGTDGRIYPWGDEPSSCEYAVMNDGTDAGFCEQGNKVWPVGSKTAGASPYGALDMAGNAWEWVADLYAVDYYADSPSENPTGPETGQSGVVRGGGEFDYYWYDVRTTARGHSRVTWRDFNLGFRCAAMP